MLVKDVMDHHPVFVDPNMPVSEVRRLIGEQHSHYIPVVGNGKVLKGLATRQTLLIDPDLLGSLDMVDVASYVSTLKVKKVMIKADDVITISPEKTIEEAAKLMVDQEVGCLPVVNKKVVQGMLTSDDILAQLTEMMMTTTTSVRATMRMPYRVGEMAKLVNAVSAAGWGIGAAGGGYDRKKEGYWQQVIKIRNAQLADIEKVLKQIPDQELVDIRQM